NIAELAKGIESGVVKKNAPNLAERLYKTLFRLDAQGRIIPLELKELKDYKFVLFYFAHGKGSSHADTVGALAENYMRWRELRPELEVIMIQCDAVVFQIPNRTDIQWPFMAASQSLAYLEALHLGQNPHVDSFVITGINGNIVHRYDLSVDTIPSIVESIESILSNQQ
ncbi:MAG: hypothetical protein H8E75_07540, partial [Puniceicoccaceae bacterium]|nr:hypothetical protein [Puniceicoccaceae bacterium]